MQWPNTSLKQNRCLAFCCCSPDSANRCWWHLFLTGVPLGTTPVNEVPHLIFNKENAFVSFTVHHSSVLIMSLKQMPWFVTSKCQVIIYHTSQYHIPLKSWGPRIVSHEDKNVEHLAEPHQRLHHQSLQRWILLFFVGSELGKILANKKNRKKQRKKTNTTQYDSVSMQHLDLFGISKLESYHEVQRVSPWGSRHVKISSKCCCTSAMPGCIDRRPRRTQSLMAEMPKSDMEVEHGVLEWEIPFGNLLVSKLNLGRVKSTSF